MDTDYIAGWVPWDDQRSPTLSANIAARWLGEQSKDRGLSRLLVTNHQSIWHGGGPDVIEQWAKYDGTTPRGSGPKKRGPHAVLCYAPTYKSFSHALRYADGGAIAVVDWKPDALVGWAMAVGARNLITGENAGGFDDGTRALLEDIDFCGNNGWARGYGREGALRAVEDFGWIDPNIVAGYMLAVGHHAESVEELRRLLRRR